MKRMKYRVGKQFEISYAHYLQDYDGKCSEVHGHNAIVELVFSTKESKLVTKPSPLLDARTAVQKKAVHSQSSGMVIDFSQIKSEIEESVKENLDHKNLNEITFFKDYRPTAENICFFIYQCIPDKYINQIETIRVWEDRDSYAELVMSDE
jgi:6-pyruvoyltetrahydropterin/6-carboxytetrahydropterin synthase